MKVTLRQVWDARAGLNKLGNLDLPIKTGYWVQKLIKQVNKEIKDLDEQRRELVQKYTPEGEDTVPEDKVQDFQQEFFQFLDDTEAEINCHKIDVDKLEAAGAKLSAMDLLALEPFLSETPDQTD